MLKTSVKDLLLLNLFLEKTYTNIFGPSERGVGTRLIWGYSRKPDPLPFLAEVGRACETRQWDSIQPTFLQDQISKTILKTQCMRVGDSATLSPPTGKFTAKKKRATPISCK